MTMFRCAECGELFNEDEFARWEETHGLDSPPYEKFVGSPCCFGGFDEVKPCKICGEYACIEHEDYCGNCRADVHKRFADFVNKEFSDAERDLLNEIYEGERI